MKLTIITSITATTLASLSLVQAAPIPYPPFPLSPYTSYAASRSYQPMSSYGAAFQHYNAPLSPLSPGGFSPLRSSAFGSRLGYPRTPLYSPYSRSSSFSRYGGVHPSSLYDHRLPAHLQSNNLGAYGRRTHSPLPSDFHLRPHVDGNGRTVKQSLGSAKLHQGVTNGLPQKLTKGQRKAARQQAEIDAVRGLGHTPQLQHLSQPLTKGQRKAARQQAEIAAARGLGHTPSVHGPGTNQLAGNSIPSMSKKQLKKEMKKQGLTHDGRTAAEVHNAKHAAALPHGF